MARDRIVKVTDLDVKLTEILSGYHAGINAGIEYECEKAVKDLAKITKTTSPVGESGTYRKNITSGVVKKTRWSSTYAWYVKPPDHRLTHLLVHGHETKNGGRTKSNPFLHNALDKVLQAFETGVQSVFDYYNNINNVDGKYHNRGQGD